MKRTNIILALIPILTQMAWAGELTSISAKFVEAATEGNIEDLASTLWDGGPAKDELIDELKKVAPEIKNGTLKFTKIDRELVIGELGVTLMRLDAKDGSVVNYKPILCLRVRGQWLIFPWATEEHMKVLFDQRSKEEQIHLELFNEWANLMEKLLNEEEESEMAGQPAAKSADKPPVKPQPSAPTQKDQIR